MGRDSSIQWAMDALEDDILTILSAPPHDPANPVEFTTETERWPIRWTIAPDGSVSAVLPMVIESVCVRVAVDLDKEE